MTNQQILEAAAALITRGCSRADQQRVTTVMIAAAAQEREIKTLRVLGETLLLVYTHELPRSASTPS